METPKAAELPVTPASSVSSSSVATSTPKKKLDVMEFKAPALPVSKKKRIVLEEDKYALQLEKIVERDYFPDLEKLNAQNAYLNALATNDIHMLRELYSKYSFGKRTPRTTKSDSTLETPSTFETPIDIQSKTTPAPPSLPPGTPTHLPMEEPSKEDDVSSTSSKNKIKANDPTSMSLNDYLNTYTSEDNQSFQDFMEEAERKHRVKYSWLYDTEEEAAKKQIANLEVPSIEQQADVYKRPLDIETWGYKTKNYVMYVPDGVPLSAIEEVELAKKQASVVFANTRFKKTPFKEAGTPSNAGAEPPGTGKGLFKQTEGRIGVDGKEIESSTPKVKGFSYVRTPSPTPDVEESPFMTWGEIEGTPFRLDAGDTPILAPATTKPYKIFEQSKREKLAIELAEKVSYRYRDKKLKAMQAARSHLATPSPSGLKRGIEKLNTMTPAAQKFAKSHFGSRIGSSDQALRNSYTPKRIGTPGTSRSSIKTPNSSSTPTPSSFSKSATTPTPSASKSGLNRPPTVTTDDLLRLPVKPKPSSDTSKPKAADFF